jgi:hypothetical protein
MTGSRIVFISTSMTSNDVQKKYKTRQNIFFIAENIFEVYTTTVRKIILRTPEDNVKF